MGDFRAELSRMMAAACRMFERPGLARLDRSRQACICAYARGLRSVPWMLSFERAD
jgi:hypothetical protein